MEDKLVGAKQTPNKAENLNQELYLRGYGH